MDLNKLPPLAVEILGADLVSEMSSAFEAMEWAEDEIVQAQRRHPTAADRIWHSFKLLVPTHPLSSRAEVVYRAHCRELLERVAAGEDTRPGTAVECCAALSDTSAIAPLTTTGTGLYLRMWWRAGLPPVTGDPDTLDHYEAIRGSTMDDEERRMRAKLSQPDRQLPRVLEHRPWCPAGQAGDTAPALAAVIAAPAHSDQPTRHEQTALW